MELAKDVGEWAGYILLALVVIALVKRIPYRWFRLVHKAFGAVFLAGAFHGLMMLPGSFWAQPLGWLTALLAAAGVVPAVLSLSGRIGRQRQYPAKIETLNQHGDGILEVTCRPHDDWPGHRAGQFLLANFGIPPKAPIPSPSPPPGSARPAPSPSPSRRWAISPANSRKPCTSARASPSKAPTAILIFALPGRSTATKARHRKSGWPAASASPLSSPASRTG